MLTIDHLSAPPPDFAIVTICDGTVLPGAAETLRLVGFTTSDCAETDDGANSAAMAIRRPMRMKRDFIVAPTFICVRASKRLLRHFGLATARANVPTPIPFER